MAEKNKPEEKKKSKQEEKYDQKSEEKKEKKGRPEVISEEVLIRILQRDIPGSKKVSIGLTKIKGVSWSIANAVVIKLGIPANKKVSDLSKDEITQIEQFLKNADIPEFMKNRRRDMETGISKHYTGTDLDMKKDFDIRRLKKIRSYKGVRHTAGLPVRGQRTRSHFRTKGQAVKRAAKPVAAPTQAGGKK